MRHLVSVSWIASVGALCATLAACSDDSNAVVVEDPIDDAGDVDDADEDVSDATDDAGDVSDANDDAGDIADDASDAQDAGDTHDATACVDGAVEDCSDSPGCAGARTCVDGAWGACTYPAEICDGVDNDCDGEVDEDFVELGDVCSGGEGQCEAQGVIVCANDQLAVICSAVAGPDEVEVCDGVDNDCDGIVDNVEGIGDDCTVGAGRCEASGTRICDIEAGTLSCSAVAGAPQTEVCNGIDDDCDGIVDNVAGLGESCTVGAGACRRTGSRVCAPGSEALVCSVSAGSPQTEVCNGIDDDCDGTIDNVAELGGACAVGVGACRRTGSRVCDTGAEALVCSASAGSPQVEVCNGIDDNCDGTPDNTTVSLSAGQSYGADRGCIAMELGDIDNDGLLDIVCVPTISAATNPDTRVFTYLQQSPGVFSAARYLDPVPVSPFRAQSQVALADLDGDGYLDIVVAGETMKIHVYINDGTGDFEAPYEAFNFTVPGEHGTGGLLLHDMNDDGHVDIVTTIGTVRATDWRLALSLGDGNGNFGSPSLIGGGRERATAILGRDLDNDGDLDLVVVSSDRVEVLRASSPATFAAPFSVVSDTVPLGPDPLLADLDGDGFADLMLPAFGRRYYLPGTASGFGPATSIARGASEYSATAGPFDCDASQEVMIVASNPGAPLYYLETPPTLSSVDLVPSVAGNTVRAADIDGDGDTDVVVGTLGDGVRVFLRN